MPESILDRLYELEPMLEALGACIAYLAIAGVAAIVLAHRPGREERLREGDV